MMKTYTYLTLFIFLILSDVVFSQCPDTEQKSSSDTIVAFITHSAWSSQRNDMGLGTATTNDIRKLSNSSDQQVCQELNEESVALFENYDIFYYKVKNRYITVSILKQPEEPDVFSVGLSYIDIYDSLVNRLQGYSF